MTIFSFFTTRKYLVALVAMGLSSGVSITCSQATPMTQLRDAAIGSSNLQNIEMVQAKKRPTAEERQAIRKLKAETRKINNQIRRMKTLRAQLKREREKLKKSR